MEGEIRLTNSSTGGPVFVYVKDGKIVRITPMDFDETDPEGWKIESVRQNGEEIGAAREIGSGDSACILLKRN